MPGEVHVIKHPLVQHKLTLLRQKDISTQAFRALVAEISMLLAYEVTRDLPTTEMDIETPMAKTRGSVLEGKKIVLIPILRSGLGIVDGMLRILPSARIGHVGIYRDPQTLGAIEYYSRMPSETAGRDVIIAAPLLATGNSANAAVDRVKGAQPRSLKFACLVAAPEGLANFHEAHPEVPVYTAAIDDRLDDHGFIIPGIGDAGDRMFGTK
jgi:uracil phosphoribosyltransferase